MTTGDKVRWPSRSGAATGALRGLQGGRVTRRPWGSGIVRNGFHANPALLNGQGDGGCASGAGRA